MLISDFYFCALVFSLFSLLIVTILYLISYSLSEKQNSYQKLSIYECGFEPLNSPLTKFNIKYYLAALLFILFDLEIIFLFPWSLNLAYLSFDCFSVMFLFCSILTFGFLYEYRKGALEW